MALTHTDLATATVKQAVEEAVYAIGRLDDLLTDNQLSPAMVRRVVKTLKLDAGDLTTEDWLLEYTDTEALEDEPLLNIPFLKSMREVRLLFGAATSEWAL